MTSQSKQKTAFERGRTSASVRFLFPAIIYTNPVIAMWTAIFNTNTALFSICKLSKLSAPQAMPVPCPTFPEAQLDTLRIRGLLSSAAFSLSVLIGSFERRFAATAVCGFVWLFLWGPRGILPPDHASPNLLRSQNATSTLRRNYEQSSHRSHQESWFQNPGVAQPNRATSE